jgi:hypothetical protein
MPPLFPRSLGSEAFGVDRTPTDASALRPDRKWSVVAVLAVALIMMMAVPLASRALGGEATYPGCGIAPWTATCTCLMTEDSTAISYQEFSRGLRQAARADATIDPETLLATARRTCRLETRSALRD